MLNVFEKRKILTFLNKCLCLILCILLFPLSACNSKKDSIETKDSIDTKTLLAADFTSETYSAEKSYFASTELRYPSFSQDLTVNALSMTVCGDVIAVLARGAVKDGTHSQTQMCFFDKSGMETDSFVLEKVLNAENINVSYIAGSKNGITALVTIFNATLQSSVKEFCFFDTAGNKIREAVSLTLEDTSFSPTGLSVLQSGETVLSGVNSEGNVFYVYDSDMHLLFMLSGNQMTGKILESGGAVYVEGLGTQNGVQKTFLYRVDMQTGALSDVIDVSQITGDCITSSSNGKLYAQDTIGLYSIDLSGKNKTLLNWSNLDIDRSVYSFLSPFCVLSDDVVCILGISGDAGYDVGQVVMLARQASNPNMGKQTLILGGFNISYDDRLLATINTFNQSNDQYRIEMKDYYADIDWSQSIEQVNKSEEKCRQQMYLDVFTGKGPDIFYYVNDDEIEFSLAAYEANGLLMDLHPLMEKDLEFHISDFLPNVIDACTVNEKLCKIPVHFSVFGMDGKPSVTKGISSWTTGDFNQIASTLPSGMQMIVNKTKDELLKGVLAGSMNYFIDKNTKKVNFNSDEFYELLKWANLYGSEEIESSDQRVYLNENDLVKSNQLAIMSWGRIFATEAFSPGLIGTFGTVPDIIGYPSPEKNGPYMNPEEIVAVSSWCDCPDGAWSFIKYLLSDDYQTKNSTDYVNAYGLGSGYGFPVRTESLQTVINLAMNPPDIEKDGEDPDANPVKLTLEQADACLAVINKADTFYYPDLEIYAIIQEEAQAYFQGQKSVEEVSALIQDRVQTLVYERG